MGTIYLYTYHSRFATCHLEFSKKYVRETGYMTNSRDFGHKFCYVHDRAGCGALGTIRQAIVWPSCLKLYQLNYNLISRIMEHTGCYTVAQMLLVTSTRGTDPRRDPT